MNYLETKNKIIELKNELNALNENQFIEFQNLKNEIAELQKKCYESLTPWDRVSIAREMDRPKAMDYIRLLFTDFIEFHGDYYFGDDQSIVGGIGYFNETPVTVIAQAKGKTLDENLKRNFGATNPEGFRKAKRLALQAEKFKRPIITIVDTSGAYPGKGAEERGQSRAIAESLMIFSNIKVPVIAIVIGEGGSGGALALSVANKIIMLENAVYSILSPEGFASILFKDATRVVESANKMKLTSYDLKEKEIVDEIIIEGPLGIHERFKDIINEISKYIDKQLAFYSKKDEKYIVNDRYNKFRKIGAFKNE
ncbi:MAG: acetyl-CoA carboxylase carboxyltransferase subunit alpha [Erysipelotrichaceae bacterium]|nr:acetyl-CoA carboxylase carboxyltransferase subunit alpha [Erysipelotrichaceae bacterium]